MKFIDYIRLSLRNLSRQKSRTVLTIMAITVGSLSVILMASILFSARQYLMDMLNEMGAFELVTVVQDPNSTDTGGLISGGNGGGDTSLKKLDDTVLSDIKEIKHVVSATPTLSVWFKTMRLEGNDKKQWASLLSYTPSSEVFDVPLLAGRNLVDTDLDKIVVGKNFLNVYGDPKNPDALIGKKVVLMRDGGEFPDWGALPPQPPQNADKSWWDENMNKAMEINAEIVGVADNAAMDDKQSYISLAWGKRLMTSVRWESDDSARKACEEKQQQIAQQQKENGNFSEFNGDACKNTNKMTLIKDTSNLTRTGYGSIIIKVDDKDSAKAVGEEVAKMGFGANTAEQMIKQINQTMFAISLVLGAIGGISLFVAAIGIINTMVMATYERIREIGVMRACGATRAMIRRLFTFEAALLGFWGGVFGLALSIILTWLAKFIISSNGTDVGNLPIEKLGNYPLWLVLSVIAFTTLVGMLSGLGPAIRAAKLNPVEALRYE